MTFMGLDTKMFLSLPIKMRSFFQLATQNNYLNLTIQITLLKYHQRYLSNDILFFKIKSKL